MVEPSRPDPVAPWPAAFTDEFVAQVRALLDVRPVLAIVGPVGGNRNRLAAAVAEAPDGSVWWRHVARHGEQGRPYFAAREILRDLHVGPDDSPSDVEDAAATLLAESGFDRFVIVLGNADLCDGASVELASRLAARGLIKVIATLTPGTVDRLPHLMAAAETVSLPPLDHDTVRDVLRWRFGLDPHPDVVEFLLERSGGTYGVVQELTAAAWEAGALTVVEGVLVIDPDRSRAAMPQHESLLAQRSVEQLGGTQDVLDLLGVTALVEHLDADEARHHLDGKTVDAAVAHGVLLEVDGALEFAMRSEAVVLARTMTSERQTHLFTSYAHLLPRTTARNGNAVLCADWWRAAACLLPVDLAARAAREANLTGLYRRAAVFTDPAANDAGALVAPMERAFALIEIGDDPGLQHLFDTLDPANLSEDELLPYLRWVARFSTDVEQARCRVSATAEGATPVATRRRQTVLNLAGLFEQAFNQVDADLETQLRGLTFSDKLSPANRAMAFAALSAVHRHRGQPEQAVASARFALDILAASPDTVTASQLELATEFNILALISALDLTGAEDAVRTYSAGHFAQTGSARMGNTFRGFVALQQGDMQQALTNSRIALDGLRHRDPRQIRGWVEALMAQVLLQHGRTDEARAAIVEATAHPSLRVQHDLERRTALACAFDALGEPERALPLLAEVVAQARECGLLMAQIDAASLCVQIGGPSHIPALLDAVDGLEDPSGRPAVWKEFAHLAHTYNIHGLVDLADRLDAAGARFYSAEVAQYAVDAARRATDLDDATRRRLIELADPVSHRNAMGRRG